MPDTNHDHRSESVRAEYDRLREAHYLAADHLKALDRERETVLREYHSTFNAMIETSVKLQRLRQSDGSPS